MAKISSRVRVAAQLAYALAGGVFCVWLSSFVPTEGPPLLRFVPDDAVLIVHARDGYELMRLHRHPALQEFLADDDVRLLLDPMKYPLDALNAYEKAPEWLRGFVPATPEGLYPFVGREWALARLPAARDADAATGKQPKPQALFLTRVSDARGELARLALRFAPRHKNIVCYDLGAGLIAVGFNGAQPSQPHDVSTPSPLDEPQPSLRVVLRPRELFPMRLREEGDPAILSSFQFLELEEFLPPSVAKALVSPPAAREMFALETLPERIELNLFGTAGGGLHATGNWIGPQPPLPGAASGAAAAKDGPAPKGVYAEAFLPFDARAGLLKWFESRLRIKKSAVSLTREQRRWQLRFNNLDLRAVDLEEDLWPAFGVGLHLVVQDPPEDMRTTPYGILNVSLPFNGLHEESRHSLGELIRQRWERLLDAGQKTTEKQHVRRVASADFDGYLLVKDKQIAPYAWVVSNDRIAITSNAGPFSRIDPAAATQKIFEQAPALNKFSSYFARFDGQRLASTAEMFVEYWHDSLEEDLGAAEYSSRYEHVDAHIRLSGKLSRLIGRFALEINPRGADQAEIDLIWVPGSLSAPAAPIPAAAPEPVPEDDSPAPVPAPPPS
jgi:hypothetical protein